MKVNTSTEKHQKSEHDLRQSERERDVIKWGIMLAMRLDGIDAINSLHDIGLLKDPGKIVMKGPQALLKAGKINKKSLKMIASLLQEFGYIEDANDWLGEKPGRQTRCPHCGHRL